MMYLCDWMWSQVTITAPCMCKLACWATEYVHLSICLSVYSLIIWFVGTEFTPGRLLIMLLKTEFARNSGQIRQKFIFSNLLGLYPCTSHTLVFGCLRAQDVVGSWKKVAKQIPGTKITRYYLRRHFSHMWNCHCHLCPNRPKHLSASYIYFGWKNHQSNNRSLSIFVISIDDDDCFYYYKK